MRGPHARRRTPSGAPVIAVLDVGVQDEAATSAIAQLDNPTRDHTACTIVELAQNSPDGQPIYPQTSSLHLYIISTPRTRGVGHSTREIRPSYKERFLTYSRLVFSP